MNSIEFLNRPIFKKKTKKAFQIKFSRGFNKLLIDRIPLAYYKDILNPEY
jgi:hypothetical protein